MSSDLPKLMIAPAKSSSSLFPWKQQAPQLWTPQLAYGTIINVQLITK
jgi:hypothetical protein